MFFVEIELKDILRARDERALKQRGLLEKHGLPLVSVCLNIAGPIKRSFMSDFLFDQTVKEIENRLGEPAERLLTYENTGCEALFAYDHDAGSLKDIAIELENAAPAGRLLDIDVIDPDGRILARDEKRGCIICGKPGTGCARSRAHSVSELQNKTASILYGYVAAQISKLAVGSLKEELLLTPKPGLVDRANSGAHEDMDLDLMLISAESLAGYFKDAAELGMSSDPLDHLALALQTRGKQAEEDMLRITRGVNTHKGAVYGMGLLCFGAGAMAAFGCDTASVASKAASLIPASDGSSHGRSVLERYHIGGARDEALNGFKTASSAALLLSSGIDPLRVFIEILSETGDTNLLWRGGIEGLRYAQDTARKLSAISDDETLKTAAEKADQEFIRRRLSPGGCADIFAQALFLEKILPIRQKQKPSL